MSTKTPNWNLALTSQTLMSPALVNAAPMKKTRRWIEEGEVIQKKGWKTTMEGYNWKLKAQFHASLEKDFFIIQCVYSFKSYNRIIKFILKNK